MFKKLLLLLLPFLLLSLPVFAEEAKDSQPVPEAFHATQLPLPRFVSLQADEVYVRSGPGVKYPIKWVYKKPGLPVEIVLEYEVWRKIKDYQGAEGWVHQSLLSGKRTGVIQEAPVVATASAPEQKKEPIVEKPKEIKPFEVIPKVAKAPEEPLKPPPIPIYQKPRENARWAAEVEPGAIVTLEQCVTGWCLISAQGYKGWAERKYIWGLYESELFD